MNGQLYQPCEGVRCTTEPVCAMCMFCTAHCQCPSAAEVKATSDQRKRRVEISEGYQLIEEYIKEFGYACQNPTGKAIADTRHYHTGAGYGPGSTFAVDMAGAIYLTVHTGSDVAKWASHSYILPEVDDYPAEGESYTNASIIEALANLSQERPLCRRHRRAFAI